MEKNKPLLDPGATEAPESLYIQITPQGPYLVFGNPPIDQQYIRENEEGDSWSYEKGQDFDSGKQPVALCRCGESKHMPFCDGSHAHADWNPEETDSKQSITVGTETIDGPTMTLYDNEKYCAFARFCDAYGRVWNLVLETDNPQARELVKHEVTHCPAGRLYVKDKETGEFIEQKYVPGLSLIEDDKINSSGPIWVKGGIRIISSDGQTYPVRNRATLCRCGQSSNKPFCDGTHASFKWDDGLRKK